MQPALRDDLPRSLLAHVMHAHMHPPIQDGWTAAMWAAHKGHKERLELLLAQDGVDVNKTNKVRVWMGVRWGVQTGEVGRGMQRLSGHMDVCNQHKTVIQDKTRSIDIR